ncbi:MAG: hypothetical protein GY816_21170 [Cytophagales bacterium]|nr:hypothetical protein [Cytophagales bacterium]
MANHLFANHFIMTSETFILLNSSRASFPEGRKRLVAEFSFQPPLQLLGGDRFFAVSDFQLETTGLLYEVVCNLEYATPQGVARGQWRNLQGGQTLYCRSLDDLVEQLNDSFKRIPKGPPLVFIDEESNAITIAANNYTIRFSEEMRRLLDFDGTQIDSKDSKTSGMTTESFELPRSWPVYCTLEDALELNSYIPGGKYGDVKKPPRRESILYYVDLSPDEHKYETVNPSRLIWCKIAVPSLHKVTLAFRYAATGNAIRTVGHGDGFQMTLLEKKRLCLGL